MASAHAILCAELLARLGARPDVRLWHQTRFSGRITRGGQEAGYLKSGVKGMADLTGFVTVHGVAVRLEIEAKTGAGRLGSEQLVWQAVCLNRGVVHIVARSVDQAERELVAAIIVLEARIAPSTAASPAPATKTVEQAA